MLGFRRGGRGRATGSSPGAATITNFVLENTQASTSLGYKRIGMPFKDGDIPAGTRVVISRAGSPIAAQFDNRSYWPSGSLRFCTACLRDTDFTASLSRTYDVGREDGAFVNTSSATLANVTGANSNFIMDFTSITTVNGSVVSAVPNLSASFNTHAGVSTRITQYEKGSVCDSWMIWGMTNDGSADHSDLKINWFVSRWKTAGGVLVAFEPTAVPALDWWDSTTKYKMDYIAALKNGGTTIETYGGAFLSTGSRRTHVQHPYHSWWATVRLTDDHQHAARHWVGATRPTLIYKPDQEYWIRTNLIPPYDLDRTYDLTADFTNTANDSGGPVYQPHKYQPCSGQNHRGFIDGTGGYIGRGLNPVPDGAAFVSPTAMNIRISRVNSLAGLHVPHQKRTKARRTRPGETTSDVANTLFPLILLDGRNPTPPSYYDFTGDGLPVSQDGYSAGGTAVQAGYTVAPGSGSVGTKVGEMTWTPAGGSTHHPIFNQYNYMLEGERYQLESILNLGVHTIQGINGGAYGGKPAGLLWYNPPTVWYPGTPIQPWAGISVRMLANYRGVAFAAILLSNMCLVPEDDVHSNYVKKLISHNAKYLSQSHAYLPASFSGMWSPSPANGANKHPSHFFESLITMGLYYSYGITKDVNWKPMADAAVTGHIFYVANNHHANMNAYRFLSRPKDNLGWSPTNDYFPGGLLFGMEGSSTVIDGATNTISGLSSKAEVTLTAGDKVLFSSTDASGVTGTIPPEVVHGQVYYVVNPTGTAASAFQISATPGGAPINFNANYGGSGSAAVTIGMLNQKGWNPAEAHGAIYPSDDYIWMGFAALAMAFRFGRTGINQAHIDSLQVWYDQRFDPEGQTDPLWAIVPYKNLT